MIKTIFESFANQIEKLGLMGLVD